jgi:hypothetical protein
MGSSAAALQPDHEPVPPPLDPLAIRACLTPEVAAEFDAEWDIVLDKAKQSKDLAPVHALLHKWRHFAYSEMKDPGCYFAYWPRQRARWRLASPLLAACRVTRSRT